MNLKSIMVSREKSKTQKITFSLTPFIRHPQSDKTSDRAQISGCQEGGGAGDEKTVTEEVT